MRPLHAVFWVRVPDRSPVPWRSIVYDKADDKAQDGSTRPFIIYGVENLVPRGRRVRAVGQTSLVNV